MEQMFMVCLGIGILIPLLSLVFGFIDMSVDFISLDLFDIDLGDFDIDFLPLSGNSICMGLVIFGSVGWTLTGISNNNTFIIAVSLISAYIAAVITQSIIKWLKRYSAEPKDMIDAVGKTGIVVNAIMPDGYGSVRIDMGQDSAIVMPAMSKDGAEIEQNAVVEILEINNHTVIVQKK